MPFVKGDPNINRKGRPIGPSLKEWVRNKLLSMTDEERTEFLKTVPLDLQWQMAEGRPEQKAEVAVKQKVEFTEEELLAAQQILEKRLNPEQGGLIEASIGETLGQ